MLHCSTLSQLKLSKCLVGLKTEEVIIFPTRCRLASWRRLLSNTLLMLAAELNTFWRVSQASGEQKFHSTMSTKKYLFWLKSTLKALLMSVTTFKAALNITSVLRWEGINKSVVPANVIQESVRSFMNLFEIIDYNSESQRNETMGLNWWWISLVKSLK